MEQKSENCATTKMNRLKFVLLLQLVTFALGKSRLSHDIQNDKVNNDKFLKRDDNTIFGKSATEVEKSVKSFILSLSVPLEKRLLQDFRRTSFRTNFKKAVSISTKVVVKNIRSFRRKLGIFNGNNSSDIEVSILDKNDTLESNLIQNGLIVATEFIDFVINSNDVGMKFFFGNRNSGTKLSKSNLWPSSQIMDFFIFTSKFFVYVDCATNNTNVQKSMKYLSSHSSTAVMEYLKKNLKTPSKNGDFNATQTICYSLENIIPGGYKKCIYDLNNVYSCIQYQIPIQTSQQGTESYQILQNAKKLFSKKWVSNVRILEPRCAIKGDQQFKCNFINKKLRSTKNQVKYVIENYIGKQIKSGSSLSKIANRFSKVVSKNLEMKRIIRDYCDYVAVWQAGQKKRNLLKKMSKKNPKLSKEFRQVSKSFYNYKNGIVKQLLNAIIAFNQIPAYLEKSFEKAFSKQSKQTLFSSILTYLSRLLKAIFDRDTDASGYKMNVDYNKNSTGLVAIQEELPYFHPRMSTEDLFDNMLRTMNHIKSQNRNLLRNKSVFKGGLTNILLTLMFLETLSAVTLLMSQNINISQVDELFPVGGEGIPEPDPNLDEDDDDDEENEDDLEDENDEEEKEDDEEEEDQEEKKPAIKFAKRRKRFSYHNSKSIPNFSNFR